MCLVKGRVEPVMPPRVSSPVCGVGRSGQARNPCAEPAPRHSETKGSADIQGCLGGGGFSVGLGGEVQNPPPTPWQQAGGPWGQVSWVCRYRHRIPL